jgi:hypothetical protein
MDPNWMKVYSSNQLWQVELIKGLLADHDIESIIVNKKDSSYLFGEVELYVNVEDAFTAKQIIIKSERG